MNLAKSNDKYIWPFFLAIQEDRVVHHFQEKGIVILRSKLWREIAALSFLTPFISGPLVGCLPLVDYVRQKERKRLINLNWLHYNHLLVLWGHKNLQTSGDNKRKLVVRRKPFDLVKGRTLFVVPEVLLGPSQYALFIHWRRVLNQSSCVNIV